MDVVFPAILVMGVALLALIVLSLLRFLGKSKRPNWGITLCGLVIIGGAVTSLIELGSGIDPGFEIFCYGLIAVSLVLIGLNYRIKR